MIRFRRAFTKLILLAFFVTLIGPFEVNVTQSVEAEFDDGFIRASTIQTTDQIQLKPLLSARVDDSTGAAYEDSTTFLSQIYTADFPFDAVEMDWQEFRPEGTELELWVRFRTETGSWTTWFDVHESIDYRDGTDPDLKDASTIVPTQRSEAIQYKVKMSSDSGAVTPRLQNMQFHYIDASGDGPDDPSETIAPPDSSNSSIEEAPRAKLSFGSSTVDVISRSEWGADESWRLSSYYGVDEEEEEEEESDVTVVDDEDDGKNGDEPSLEELYPEEFEISQTVSKDSQGRSLYWPLDYATNIEKIIVHHTAGELTDDPEATIRAIYYYHSVRRGWGDIGYNYIVANGKVYEGRFGGERIVGGHASGFNTGSIGIAVIGNYEEEEVSFETIDALSSLIHEKADLYNLNMDGTSRFHGETMPNLVGHRDVGSTQCPGENLYKMLPTLRSLIANGINDLEGSLINQTVDDPYAFVNTNSYEAFVLGPEEAATFELKLKNIGTETWNSNTYLVANRNANAEALVHLVKEDDNAVSIASMQETSVAPGQTATFRITAEATFRGGFDSFDVTPIFNGSKKTTHYLDLPVYVEAAELTYDIVDVDVANARVKIGTPINVDITLKNTGNVNWYRDGDYPLSLGTSNPHDRKSSLLTGDANRFAQLNEVTVEPGEEGTFTLSVTAPTTTGGYQEYAAPVIDGTDWLEGEEIVFTVVVYNPNSQANVVDVSEDTNFEPGEKKEVWIELENTGELTWKRSKLSVGKVHHPSIEVTSPILEESQVAPDGSGKVTFSITAPETPGNYMVYLRPRYDGQNLVTKHIRFEFTVVDGETSESDEVDQESVRVKISYETAESGDPVISADGDFAVYVDGSKFLSLEGGDEVEVRESGEDYQLLQGGQAWVVDDYPRFVAGDDDTILELVSYDNPPSWSSTSDNLYRGVLEVREDEGQLIIINELPMEYYLKGVAESTNTQPHEKQKAMAILARTYVRYYLEKAEKFPGKPYDASDDPAVFQKYLGYRMEDRAPTWVDAVDETAGMVVTYNGELVKTPYFSSTDGTATRSAEEVWGWTNTPYLVSVPDPLCESTAFSGHGVGLSGCGATAAAEAGSTYDEIIHYYYTGVEIEVK